MHIQRMRPFREKRCSSYSELWVTAHQYVLIITAEKQQKTLQMVSWLFLLGRLRMNIGKRTRICVHITFVKWIEMYIRMYMTRIWIT